MEKLVLGMQQMLFEVAKNTRKQASPSLASYLVLQLCQPDTATEEGGVGNHPRKCLCNIQRQLT